MSTEGLEVFQRPKKNAPRSRKMNGHSVVKAYGGGYQCKCGYGLATRITKARELQRYHVADVWAAFVDPQEAKPK